MKLTDHADRERAHRLDREAAHIRDAIDRLEADAGSVGAATRLARISELFGLAQQRRDAEVKP